MRKPLTHAEHVALSDALDFFVGKTASRLSEESGVALSRVKGFLRDRIEADTIERKGNLFRIKNLAPWRKG